MNSPYDSEAESYEYSFSLTESELPPLEISIDEIKKSDNNINLKIDNNGSIPLKSPYIYALYFKGEVLDHLKYIEIDNLPYIENWDMDDVLETGHSVEVSIVSNSNDSNTTVKYYVYGMPLIFG